MIHCNFYNKYYDIYFYKDHIKIYINFIPENNYNKNKLYNDLIIYYSINKIKIIYKNTLIHKNELKNLIYYKRLIKKHYFTTL